jgi:hypothetical protein
MNYQVLKYRKRSFDFHFFFCRHLKKCHRLEWSAHNHLKTNIVYN